MLKTTRRGRGALCGGEAGMGRQDVRADLDAAAVRAFTKHILEDLRALEHLITEGAIESAPRRIGAEQEVFLVDRGWRPHPVALPILEALRAPEFTTEIAKFNLELNLPPLELAGDCFTALERRLTILLGGLGTEAARHGAGVVLTGILPTINKSDLTLANITPRERYLALNDALTRMSGGSYRLHIQGTDELHIEHDSVMLEACNSSFQVHLQVGADEFPAMYNMAQAIAGPVLAAAVNSPLLFGKRLWAETRIALFQQSIDTRGATPHVRDLTPRVRFGERWVRDSILELFQEDVARIPALFVSPSTEHAFDVLERGGIPKLHALQLFNSTVYRWNRPCYGVLDGRPHLRIECRTLPAGPSVADEVANAAFWAGLMLGGSATYGDVADRLDFDDARANLLAAARRGLNAGFTWLGGASISARELILGELVPIADRGLTDAGIDRDARERYLGIIAHRVETGRTGARWLLQSLAGMGRAGTRAERLAALTAATAARQANGTPGHEWAPAAIDEGGGWRHNYLRVEQYMTTDLYTVKEGELVDLAAFLMDWKHVRQVPVEDDARRLVGLVSYGAVLRLLAESPGRDGAVTVPVTEIMDPNPITVRPETTTLEAIRLMRDHCVSCLPVVQDGTLVGIVSVGDLVPIAERLLAHKLDDD